MLKDGVCRLTGGCEKPDECVGVEVWILGAKWADEGEFKRMSIDE